MFLRGRVFSEVINDRLLFRFFSDRCLSLIHNPLFQVCRYFFIKKMSCYVLIYLTKMIAKNIKKYWYDRNTKQYIENICRQFSDLQIVYIAKIYYSYILHKSSGSSLVFCLFLFTLTISIILFYFLSFLLICCH